MKDRRRFERFSLELPAAITVFTNGVEGKALNLMTCNISAGGVYFDTADTLPEGTEVLVDVSLQSTRLRELTGSRGHLRIGGIVSRAESSGMAICFHDSYEMTSVRG